MRALLILLCLLLTTTSFAYQRKTTDVGVPLAWDRDIFIGVGIGNLEHAYGISHEGIEKIVLDSITAWNEYLKKAGGPTIVRRSNNPNLVITVQDVWVFSQDAVASTSNTFATHTGEILHSNIYLNPRVAFTNVDNGCEMGTDLQSTITHEIGHSLGLAHSSHEEATMYTEITPCEIKKRDLHDDDINGIFEIYYRDLMVYERVGCNTANSKLPVWWLVVLSAFLLRRKY